MHTLFISSKGSQYRYFKALSKSLKQASAVVTLFPCFGYSLIRTGLDIGIIKEGTEFHLERKLRKYKKGKPSALLWSCYKVFSYLYFSLVYLKFNYFLKRSKPSVICIWNGHRLPEMAIKAVALRYKIPIAYFENGLLPDTTTMDFSGVNAFSSLSKSPEFYLDYSNSKTCESLSSGSLVVRENHKKKKDQVGLADYSERYIFVPFQVNYDSQVVINSPRVNSMSALFDLLLDVIDDITDKNIKIYVKEHPSDEFSYVDFYNKHPRIIFVKNNTEELIRNAEAIITLNSSVGIESIMLEKKVIVLGNACFNINKMVLSVLDPKDLKDTINLLPGWDIDIKLTRSFFNYLKNVYLLPVAWQKQQKQVNPEHINRFNEKITEGIEMYAKGLINE